MALLVIVAAVSVHAAPYQKRFRQYYSPYYPQYPAYHHDYPSYNPYYDAPMPPYYNYNYRQFGSLFPNFGFQGFRNPFRPVYNTVSPR